MASEQEEESYSEEYIYMFMDAAGQGLPVDASSVEIIDMEMRHNAFEVAATDAAMEMLGLTPPIDDSTIVDTIEDAVKQLRAGEELECKETFPAATLGVLWGWYIVKKLGWQWRAVRKDWWETLAVTDPLDRYVILPVQYMRGIAGDDEEIVKWPHDYIDDILKARLPAADSNRLIRIC